ncbi:MAG: FIST C-terminal domain-containing protein [Lyngbya sp. HA4199-MV5]|jgi:hypothetical protein|nr:FIST C-terminal domain-containing protein [Lyngbya sp. HA4199-MV5]
MFKVAVGHSNDPDSLVAANELLEQCRVALAGDLPQAGILFAAIDFDHALILHRIQEAFPGITLIGGTTNGELSSVLKFQQDSLTLMVFASDDVEIYAGLGRDVSTDPIAAAYQAVAAAKAKATHSPQLCLTFPDSLTASGVLVLDGLKQALGTVPIVGGMTADDYTFKKTHQFFQTDVLVDSVPVLLFSGHLLFSHGVASGWNPIGKRSQITKVEGNTVYEIDGQRALDFYQHYLGADTFTSQFAIHALAIFEPQGERFYMRAPSGYDSETGSVSFLADIPEHAIVQMTNTSRDEILAASEASLQEAIEHYPGTEPAAALLISCAARRRILGTRTNEEYQLVESAIPKAIPSCGFYTYGEIAPLENHRQTWFHNKTFVSLLLGSR